MTDLSLVVVTAGITQPSSTRLLADRLAASTRRQLLAAGRRAEIRAIELRDHAQDLTSNLMTAFPGPRLRETIEAVLDADGLIAVSPIYNASYSGLFKMFFDVIERDALARKPVLIAATGGTVRHSLALDHAFRPMFAYLNATVVPTAVFAASEDWGKPADPQDVPLVERIERAATELASLMLVAPQRTSRDPFEDPTPFEQLLEGPATSR